MGHEYEDVNNRTNSQVVVDKMQDRLVGIQMVAW